jgi:membrane protein YqaA with SNARE-associated domain
VTGRKADHPRVSGPRYPSREDLLGLVVLFTWSFAAATILPLSSEVPLAVVVRSSDSWFVPVLVATVGNSMGASTTYWLARAALIVASPTSNNMRRAAAWLARYGPPGMMLSWVPVIGDLLVALAGAARRPFWRFAVWMSIGKFARYVAVALAVDRL